MLDVKKIRKDFPILDLKVYGKQLVYFDNAATTQKPQSVIDALVHYYSKENSNIHRGVHFLSQQATVAYEEMRKKIQQYINAKESHEIIFTRGTTESINLVASSFGERYIKKGDEVIISGMEHHSNIVPWQMICEKKQAKLKVIPINEQGELEIDSFEKLLNEKTKIIAITHASNVLGTINPIKTIIEKAHQLNIPVLIDGAQGISHLEVDVQKLDCDFYCFSAHKMYGPMGVGVVYGKENLLNEMPPYQGGGEMIKEVTFEKTTYNELPFKFEAGTPNVGDALAFGAALDYISAIGINNMHDYENHLLNHATKKLQEVGGVKIFGLVEKKTSVLSFILDNSHPFDAGVLLDKQGIAVRIGHHCAQPIMDRYKIPGTIRASFAVYNTIEEIDIFIEALKKAKQMLS